MIPEAVFVDSMVELFHWLVSLKTLEVNISISVMSCSVSISTRSIISWSSMSMLLKLTKSAVSPWNTSMLVKAVETICSLALKPARPNQMRPKRLDWRHEIDQYWQNTSPPLMVHDTRVKVRDHWQRHPGYLPKLNDFKSLIIVVYQCPCTIMLPLQIDRGVGRSPVVGLATVQRRDGTCQCRSKIDTFGMDGHHRVELEVPGVKPGSRTSQFFSCLALDQCKKALTAV